MRNGQKVVATSGDGSILWVTDLADVDQPAGHLLELDSGENNLIAAFRSGAIASLSTADGQINWVVDTTADSIVEIMLGSEAIIVKFWEGESGVGYTIRRTMCYHSGTMELNGGNTDRAVKCLM